MGQSYKKHWIFPIFRSKFPIMEAQLIKQIALSQGFDLCGITPARHLADGEKRFQQWLESGYGESLEYMHRNCDKRFDARLLVEGARSVVVCAVSYKTDADDAYYLNCRTKVASYARNRDYHKSIKKMLQKVLKQLQEHYPSLQGRAFVDSAPISEKLYAVEAGLGWVGGQSLLITPQFGSFIHLGVLVLNDKVDSYDKPYEGVGCGECRRCIDACPTGAIIGHGTIDTRRCISCHTIEAEPQNSIDLNGWIFGCDECQRHCPYNKMAPLHSNEAFNPIFDPAEYSAERWLAMSEEEFADTFAATPLKRSGLRRIQQNVERNTK